MHLKIIWIFVYQWIVYGLFNNNDNLLVKTCKIIDWVIRGLFENDSHYKIQYVYKYQHESLTRDNICTSLIKNKIIKMFLSQELTFLISHQIKMTSFLVNIEFIKFRATESVGSDIKSALERATFSVEKILSHLTLQV